MKEQENKNAGDVIAFRKSCRADGTGLAHYVLSDHVQTSEKEEG